MSTVTSIEELAARAVSGERDALDDLVVAVQLDVYRLGIRMLADPIAAQDATQEILIRVITHLASFHGESSLRTWIWRIATRHLLQTRRSRREIATDFDQIARMIDAGASVTDPTIDALDARRLADDVRRGCTQAMLLALDREQRLAYVLGDLFELGAEQAAEVLEIAPATYRKRLERARSRLSQFMTRKCGIVNPVAACRCLRQLPFALANGLVSPTLPSKPSPSTHDFDDAYAQMGELERIATLYRRDDATEAPAPIAEEIRRLVRHRRLPLLNA